MTPTSILSALAALAGITAFIILSGRMARLTRFGGQSRGIVGRLAIIESLNLDPRRRLVLVRCDGRSVLLLTGQQDHVVGWLPDAPL